VTVGANEGVPTGPLLDFLGGDPRDIAPRLIGWVVRHGPVSARIVEVEAYCGADDPASHARNGETPRTATMFGPPGRWYVYFTYGMHWCANVVCGPQGTAGAVLLRAAIPETGLAAMRRRRRAARRDRDLCSGPAKLCQALGVDGSLNGTSVDSGPLQLEPGGPWPYEGGGAAEVVATARVGISAGTELPWRWAVAGNPNLSVPVRS
jgi:DNA-3-methyladenine glycosylase